MGTQVFQSMIGRTMTNVSGAKGDDVMVFEAKGNYVEVDISAEETDQKARENWEIDNTEQHQDRHNLLAVYLYDDERVEWFLFFLFSCLLYGAILGLSFR